MSILPVDDSSSLSSSHWRPSFVNQFSSSLYLPRVDPSAHATTPVTQRSTPRSPSSCIGVSSNASDMISPNPDSISSTQLIQDSARRLLDCQRPISARQNPALSVPPRPLTPNALEVARLQADLKRKDAMLTVHARKLTVDSVGLLQSSELRQQLEAVMSKHSEAKDEVQEWKMCVTRRDAIIQDLEKHASAEAQAAKRLQEELRHADSKLARMKVILGKWTSDRDLQKELNDSRELSKLLGIVQASDAAECVQKVETAMADLDSHRYSLKEAEEKLQLSTRQAGELRNAYQHLQHEYGASKVESAQSQQQRNQLAQKFSEASKKSCYWEKLYSDSGKDAKESRQFSVLLSLFKASDAGECIQMAERVVADLDRHRLSLQQVQDEVQLSKTQIGKMKGANEILQWERDASKVEVAQLQQQRNMFEQKAEEADTKSRHWESQFNELQKTFRDQQNMSKLLGIFQANDAGECVQRAERAVASLDTHQRSLKEVQEELQIDRERVAKLEGANDDLQRDCDASKVEVAEMQQQRIHFKQTTEEEKSRSHHWHCSFEMESFRAEGLQADLDLAKHEQQRWMSDPENSKLVSELETQSRVLELLHTRIEDLQVQNGTYLKDLCESEKAEQLASEKMIASEKQQEQLRTIHDKRHEDASRCLRDELNQKSLELMQEKDRSQKQEQEFQQEIHTMKQILTDQDKLHLAETRKALEEISKNGGYHQTDKAAERIDALENNVRELCKTRSRICSIS
eukprot:TRINITY_DN43749_c0_g1_i1.p1 TRINITY_DN43749_c0_g1~~TRINITY_DN43749_c0_g1_i1.p1  ORF type:complete len:746 (-),score=167.66 TRINITY_DN43749_c0_g1_i1:299-2536(-)